VKVAVVARAAWLAAGPAQLPHGAPREGGAPCAAAPGARRLSAPHERQLLRCYRFGRTRWPPAASCGPDRPTACARPRATASRAHAHLLNNLDRSSTVAPTV